MAEKEISKIEKNCIDKGMRMTGQRRVIARVLSDSQDHPDVEEIHRRAAKLDSQISIATVYRTLRLFDTANVIDRLEFGDGRARYELNDETNHYHLLDVKSGKVVEFENEEVDRRLKEIAANLGYRLMGNRLDLYCTSLETENTE